MNWVARVIASPGFRFLLMLGGGVVASLAVGHVQWWLAHMGSFPASEAVWLARIDGMKWLGMGAMLVIGLVMITLAWGRASGVKVSNGTLSAEVEFDEQPTTVATVTTEVKA